MNRNLAVAALLVWAVLLAACSSMESMMGMGSSASLPSTLTKQLGVNESQAAGGTGAILAFAQQRLAAGDFDLIAKAIPGSEQYLGLAKQLLGGMNINDKAGLQSAFSKMGMSPDMLSKFTPIVTDYVNKAGGAQAGSLVAGLLK
ncbi:MAG TPA: DUF2780 domain-containing protein [Burkholderiales bacterium]|jgi:hypothetical protein